LNHRTADRTEQAKAWKDRPAQAFATWLGQARAAHDRPLRASSQTIYRGMFEALLAHLTTQGVGLAEVTPEHIEAFLAAREVDLHRRHRYLLLFSRMSAHLQGLGLVGSRNAARELLLEDPRPQDSPAQALTPEEVQRLLQALPSVGRGAWRQARLRAVVHTLLHTGLRSSELIELTLDQVAPSTLEIRAAKPRPSRSIPIDLVLQGVLQEWLAERSARLVATDRVFPSNPSGDAITASTLFRQIRGSLQAAGIHSAIEGPTLLRNTCAARWLATQPIAKVCVWMGYEKVQSALRFSEAAKAWATHGAQAL
jgi:integrase